MPESNDEQCAWWVVIILSIVVIVTIGVVIYICRTRVNIDNWSPKRVHWSPQLEQIRIIPNEPLSWSSEN